MLFAEFLITSFPNHDLHENGRDWRACISYINALIRYLCSAAQKKPVSYFSPKYGHCCTNAFCIQLQNRKHSAQDLQACGQQIVYLLSGQDMFSQKHTACLFHSLVFMLQKNIQI